MTNEKTISSSLNRKYAVNEAFFDLLDADSAYVLGYIWTDGCVEMFGKDRKTGSWGILLECSLKDREILDNIKKMMKTESPVRTRSRVLSYGKKIEMAKLCIYSNRLVEALMKYGIIERKSKADPIPIGIPEEFKLDFIRGVLDGDGSLGRETRNPSLFRLTFTGKQSLLRWVDQVLVGRLGVKPRKLYRSYPTKLTRSECWVIVYSRQGDIQKIMDALHNGSCLFLARKSFAKSVANDFKESVVSNAA